ncbi:uncharacterized protein LOC130704040 [Daphnia carinata]|uniref:uncharacterized protein LOC130704040 n=2 Tax=Daphnia carinata TaxID=120202 RepID=UPI00257CF6F6|nr:uncharacterized protein LOC130704040 [Daphnia carinata]XP_057381500.1 uncharacterized protein LOC130704040 [Daphnia carinata]XP_057381502.1 uncharacterized protein LOC130704040 [Daphnia carinata]
MDKIIKQKNDQIMKLPAQLLEQHILDNSKAKDAQILSLQAQLGEKNKLEWNSFQTVKEVFQNSSLTECEDELALGEHSQLFSPPHDSVLNLNSVSAALKESLVISSCSEGTEQLWERIWAENGCGTETQKWHKFNMKHGLDFNGGSNQVWKCYRMEE